MQRWHGEHIFDKLGVRGASSTFQLGSFNSATTGGGAVALLRSGRTAVSRVYGDDGGAVLTGAGSVPDIRASLSRFLVTVDNSGGHVRLFALMGHLKGYNAEWGNEQVAATHGYLELVRAAGSINLQNYGVTAGVMATVENSGAITVDTNHVLAGVAAVSKLTSDLTKTGVVAGVYVGIYNTSQWSDGTARSVWSHGVYIANSAATTGITIGTCTTGISIGACTTAISALNPINVVSTQTSATPGTHRAIYGKNVSFTSMTSGNLVGVRGEVTVGGSVSTGVFLYGVQGKLITGSNTITAGSGMIAGVFAQFDMTGGVLASGWNAALHADIFGCNADTHASLNLISGTHAGGGVINSLLYLFGKSTFVMGFESNVHDNMSTTGTPGSVTGATGWLKVSVDGVTRYIPLAESVS